MLKVYRLEMYSICECAKKSFWCSVEWLDVFIGYLTRNNLNANSGYLRFMNIWAKNSKHGMQPGSQIQSKAPFVDEKFIKFARGLFS